MIYEINKIDIDVHIQDDNRFVSIVCCSPIISKFIMVFNEQQFLSFIDDNNILEVQDDLILWDTYIEDEDGITYMETHGINFVDYVKNYLSKDVLEDIIRISLEEFTNNFNNQ
jgi:response regulator of citrate/malate metabolism